MQRMPIFLIVLLAATAPAIAAETTERRDSLPDANPECMQVNGPDCVLKSEFMPPRVAVPPGTVTPSGVVGAPGSAPAVSATPGSSAVIAPAAPAPQSTIISPRR
jgi:hypothetical protein